MQTVKPRWAAIWAVAAPIPRLPPVIRMLFDIIVCARVSFLMDGISRENAPVAAWYFTFCYVHFPRGARKMHIGNELFLFWHVAQNRSKHASGSNLLVKARPESQRGAATTSMVFPTPEAPPAALAVAAGT